jgi:hypothetical protein
MNADNDRSIGQLLERAAPAPPADAGRLVEHGMARGRALRRRQRIGTTVAAVAAVAVIGATAAVLPRLDGALRSDDAPTLSEPTASATPSAPTTSTPPNDTRTPASLAVTAGEVPDTVTGILGRDGAGPLRTAPPYTPASEPDTVVAHFSWQGTLTTVVVEKAGGDPLRACESGGKGTTCTTRADGAPQLVWGPTEGDGVTAQGASVWRHGFEVSVVSYNASDGKDVTPLMAAPPLSLDDLALVAGSEAWFGE